MLKFVFCRNVHDLALDPSNGSQALLTCELGKWPKLRGKTRDPIILSLLTEILSLKTKRLKLSVKMTLQKEYIIQETQLITF